MNSKLLKSGHIKLYKRENSKYWQMKVKLPKLKAIRSSTGSKILKDAENIALKYYSSISSKTNIKLKRTNAKGEKVEVEEEIGDVLFTVVNISRFMGISAEDMLRKSNEKFIQRFKNIEKELKLKGIPVEKATSKQMNIIWDRIKKSN